MNQEIFEKILVIFFRHQLKIKMYHFQTTLYGAHKASDSYLEVFEGKLDRFMEVAQGIVGKFTISTMKLNINTLTELTIIEELNNFIKILKLFDKAMNGQSELLNIRDELVADAEQFKYLLTFK